MPDCEVIIKPMIQVKSRKLSSFSGYHDHSSETGLSQTQHYQRSGNFEPFEGVFPQRLLTEEFLELYGGIVHPLMPNRLFI